MPVPMWTAVMSIRSLLDGKLGLNKSDLSLYKERNDLITEIESRINECDYFELSDGTTYQKVFVPMKRD